MSTDVVASIEPVGVNRSRSGPGKDQEYARCRTKRMITSQETVRRKRTAMGGEVVVLVVSVVVVVVVVGTVIRQGDSVMTGR
jgi:t-SNARE complex subunit (syntaxin)